MLQTAALLFCDHCEAATARFERGWRAYAKVERDAETSITVVCPACAEQVLGEDEAPWSD